MANPEHVKILKLGVIAWNKWRSQNPEVQPVLSGLNIGEKHWVGIDFSMTDLSNAYLPDAELSYANLINANLEKADLTRADFAHADLTNANLSKSKLYEANLVNASLAKTSLASANLTQADLTNADLTYTDLVKTDLIFAKLGSTDLRNAKLDLTDFSNAHFSGTCFISELFLSNLRYPLTASQMEGCDFSGEILQATEAQILQKPYAIPEQAIAQELDEISWPNSVSSVRARNLIRRSLPPIRPALRLTAESVLAQLAEFRERVRCDNQLRAENEEFHDELVQTLDQLALDIDSLLNTVSESNGPATDEEVEETANWIECYFGKSGSLLSSYADPEYAAERTVPLGIIAGCGALVSVVSLVSNVPLVASFGAGALAGKFYVGDAKPGSVTDKVEDELQEPEKPG